MANSGLKKVTQLRKYINGRPTDEVKENTVGTVGYIPNVVSEEECPTGCDAIVEGTTIVKGTTTTTTTTTIAVTADPILGRDYNLFNTDTQNTSSVRYTDSYSEIRNIVLQPNEETSVFSLTEPNRVSGGQVIIEPVGPITEVTTTTTTLAPFSTDDYTVSTVSASTNTVFSFTQPVSNLSTEFELAPGKQVKVSSDTTPIIVSGDQSTTITQTGTSIQPQEDTYTIFNEDFYNQSVVDYRPFLGITDEVLLSPRETREIKSQDTPSVTSGSTLVTITPSGSPTQEATPSEIQERICDQYDIYNDSEFIATFDLSNCDQVSEEVTVQPGKSISVPAVDTPTITPQTAANVGSAYSVVKVDKEYGTSGSAASVVATITTTSTTTTTTTTTAAPIVSIQDVNCNEVFEINKPEGDIWYPETIRMYVGPKTGNLKFVSFDSGFEGNLYKVYEGSTLLLDKAFITDSYNQRFMRQMYDALIAQGMPNISATEYAYGSKRVQPEKDFSQTNVRGTNFKTDLNITKTTFEEYITIEVYKPIPKGNWVTFKIECIQ